MSKKQFIEVYGAKEHNLKNIDIKIPRNELVVITGLSGSGKSSLAFDTIFAEGQRRYIETFSAYARQFLGGLERPDVDKIDGLSPVIAIEQKTVSRSPRSTVGTITEIYDFMRLLFARVGVAYSYNSGEAMVKYSDDQIVDLIIEQYSGRKIIVLAPIIKGRKGHYRELFEQITKMGFTKVRIDGEIEDIKKGLKLDRYKIHDIEIVIDRLEIDKKHRARIYDSVVVAMKHGSKELMVMDFDSSNTRHFSRMLMCPSSGISYPEPEPSLFSFNSPYGACPTCNGLGEVAEVDIDKIIPDPKISIKKGGLAPLGEYKKKWIFEKLDGLLKQEGFTLSTPIKDIDDETMKIVLYGNEGMTRSHKDTSVVFEGVINFISRHSEESSAPIQRWAASFMNKNSCSECHGTRIKKEAHYFKLNDKNIGDLAMMDIGALALWFRDLENHLDDQQKIIAIEILKEINARLGFIVEVGLTYLTLHR